MEDREQKKREERAVRAVKEAFESRREARRSLERSWELNMNFLSGNQYCDVGPAGEIVEEQPAFTGRAGGCSTTSRPPSTRAAPSSPACGRAFRCARLRARSGTCGRQSWRAASLQAVGEDAGWTGRSPAPPPGARRAERPFTRSRGTASLPGGGGVSVAAVPPFEVYPADLSCEDVEAQRASCMCAPCP